jgi:hypothetical protein
LKKQRAGALAFYSVNRYAHRIEGQHRKMRTKVQFISYEQIRDSLLGLKFDVQELPGVASQTGTDPIFVKKYRAGAILARRPKGNRSQETVPQHAAVWVHRPGFLVRGEVGTLLDRGYQKFWKISNLEVPATADSLKAVHRFAEELREAIGEPSLYNESLGTTSDVYMYDRVKGRDLPVEKRPKPAWELPSGKNS